MIEFRDPKKRLWLKAIASFLVVTFVWYDIAWAGDLFYTYGKPIPYAVAGPQKMPEPKVSKVTNHDLLDDNRKQSVAEKLLPTNREREITGSFAPSYVQEQQSKHEDIIKQKQEAEDTGSLLRTPPKRQDEEVDLKKKRSGGGGGKVKYILINPNQDDRPTAINQPTTGAPNNWSNVNEYDITMQNISQWLSGAQQKKDEKNGGIDYWIGTNGNGDTDPSRLVMNIIYDNNTDNKKIITIYTGYELTTDGSYQPKYRIDYTYSSGNSISETKKYDISNGGNRLVEKAVYEGSYTEGLDNDNRVKTIIDYGTNGSVINRTDFKYVDSVLKETDLYSTTSEKTGDGTLVQKNFFTGSKNTEIADYTQDYNNGRVTDTTVYYYAGGKRASDSESNYRYSQSKQITYKGNPDSSGDGVLTDAELDSAQKISMLVYDDTNRLATEQVADYMVTYGEGNAVTSTTIYFYVGGNRASAANYRDCVAYSTLYYGNPLDANGNVKPGEIKESDTFNDIKFRLKGEEVKDYTLNYASDGTTINTTTVYTYEGGKRANAASNTDHLQATTTYYDIALDEHGNVKPGAKMKSETFCRFTAQTKPGEELADVTLDYNRDGSVKDTVVYYYGDDKVRAIDATIHDGMTKSVTYWGPSSALIAVDLMDGSGHIDPVKLEDFIKQKFGIDLASAGSAQEALDSLLSFIAGGNSDIKNALAAILGMNPADLVNKETLVSALLALAGNNVGLMQILLSIDMASVTSKGDLITKLLVAAGLDQVSAGVLAIILSVNVTNTMTIWQPYSMPFFPTRLFLNWC